MGGALRTKKETLTSFARVPAQVELVIVSFQSRENRILPSILI